MYDGCDCWKVKAPNCRDSDDGDASGNASAIYADKSGQYKQKRTEK
jgi:hypothetical protein